MGFYQDHCVYLPAMVGWFFFSAGISSYNKYVFGDDHMSFPCPLLMTSVHFLMQWSVSWSLTEIFPGTLGGGQVKEMPWKKFLCVSVPCGLVTSGDVGLSNLALVRITITFYTMVKASSPIFVVLSAYIFGIEKITISLMAVVLIIACGEFLTVVGEVNFDTIGFVLCLSASVLSGMRWTTVQLKIQSLDPPLVSTFATMRILSPVMFLSMLVLSIAIETPWVKLGPDSGNDYFSTPSSSLFTVSLAFGGAFLAIAMVLCEFYLIMKSNAIVLMIGGVVKELLTIVVGVIFFGDNLNAVNIAGFLVVFLGVVTYKVIFHFKQMEKNAENESGWLTVDQNGDDGVRSQTSGSDAFAVDGEDETVEGGSGRSSECFEGLDDLELTVDDADLDVERIGYEVDENEPVEPKGKIV